MNNANDIREELRGMSSPLADMSRAMPYDVPQGYFEGFAEQITIYSQWATTPEPATNFTRALPYEVPQGYFEVFSRSLTRKIRENEDNLTFAKGNPLDVPEGYFDALPQQIMQRIKAGEEKPKGKLISFVPIWRKVQWAAAAVLMIGIGLGFYAAFNKGEHYDVQVALAKVPQDSISKYVTQHIDEFDTETLAASLEPGDVQRMTDKLSDEEIKGYLDEAGWDESTMNL